MAEAVLGLGGNLGARRALLQGAIALLDGLPGATVLARSRLYATPALGPPQPDYLNAAVRVRWDGDVTSLLAATQRIESQLGRERRERWGARTIDIDILDWSEGPVRAAGLEVPHRELEARSFALAPLLDVAPTHAARLAPVLAERGGAPPLAEPGWLDCADDACDAADTPWLVDVSELAACLIERIAARATPRARATDTCAIAGPHALVDARGACWLLSRVRAALAAGFCVSRAAILDDRGPELRGVLIGAAGDVPITLPAMEVRLEQRGERELRACLRAVT